MLNDVFKIEEDNEVGLINNLKLGKKITDSEVHLSLNYCICKNVLKHFSDQLGRDQCSFGANRVFIGLSLYAPRASLGI